jgi:hypothetical protein
VGGCATGNRVSQLSARAPRIARLGSAATSGLLILLSGCSDPAGGACTASFVGYTLVVTDQSGAPAGQANVSVTLERTGEHLESSPLGPYPTGTYPLIDDGAIGKLLPSGEAVRAVASKGSVSVQADFVFDVPGGCHVHKVSGPDTVALP